MTIAHRRRRLQCGFCLPWLAEALIDEGRLKERAEEEVRNVEQRPDLVSGLHHVGRLGGVADQALALAPNHARIHWLRSRHPAPFAALGRCDPPPVVRGDVAPCLRVVADPVRRIRSAGRSPCLRTRLPVAARDVGLEVGVDGRLRRAPSDAVSRIALPRPESLEGDAVPFVAVRDFGIDVGALRGERDIDRRNLTRSARTANEGSQENAQETPSRAVAHAPLDAAHPPIIPNICVQARGARGATQIVQCQSPADPQEVQCQSRGEDAQRRQNAPLREPELLHIRGDAWARAVRGARA